MLWLVGLALGLFTGWDLHVSGVLFTASVFGLLRAFLLLCGFRYIPFDFCLVFCIANASRALLEHNVLEEFYELFH